MRLQGLLIRAAACRAHPQLCRRILHLNLRKHHTKKPSRCGCAKHPSEPHNHNSLVFEHHPPPPSPAPTPPCSPYCTGMDVAVDTTTASQYGYQACQSEPQSDNITTPWSLSILRLHLLQHPHRPAQHALAAQAVARRVQLRALLQLLPQRLLRQPLQTAHGP